MYTLGDVDREWQKLMANRMLGTFQINMWIDICGAIEEELGDENVTGNLPLTTPLGPRSQEAFAKLTAVLPQKRKTG